MSIVPAAHTRTGRHRRGGAGTWTPTVPAVPPVRGVPRQGGRRRRAEPLDPPAHGSLPLPDTEYRPVAGCLPLAGDTGPLETTGELTELTLPSEPAAPPRTKVSLAPPARRPRESAGGSAPTRRGGFADTGELYDTGEVRVYSVPALDGLGKFDLGTVPASVTPPKTWRKAAWFATASSGAVVVGLLFAGSLLVSKPGTQTADPGYRGGLPDTVNSVATEPDKPPGVGGNGGNALGREGSQATDAPSTSGDQAAGTPADTSGDSAVVTTDSAGAPPPAAPVHHKPVKPSVVPAPMQSQPPQYWLQMDPAVMGQRSQDFLNEVTQSPAEANQLTGGELHSQGPAGLAKRYAHIAYFVVKNVYIDQDQGYTVNTVRTVYDDGSSVTETRTLTFGDGTRIVGDGQ